MNPHQIMAVEVQGSPSWYEYVHVGGRSTSTAFEIKEKAEIKIRISRSLGTLSATLEIYCEDLSQLLHQIDGEWLGFDGECDIYSFVLPSSDIGVGLYFMRPRINLFEGCLFGHRKDNKIEFNDNYHLYGMMQISICDFSYQQSQKIRGGVIYHIFVDRFNRGGIVDVPDGAKIIPGNWKAIPEYPEYPGAPLYNNTFYGGTLYGVIKKLDYIKSLGTRAIYLSPIFRAASNHKYDTANYMTVDPIFGGEEALSTLIKECNKREIAIILDGVFNHTGSDSIYFNRYSRYPETGAYQSKKSKYFSWYSFSEYPTKYASWWGIDILPRINPDNPECGEYFVGNGGVIDKYMSMGIYGFRLDVADELSDEFIEKIKSRQASVNEDNILFGEVWEDASNKCSYSRRRRYYLGNELDGVMNYPVRNGIIDFLLLRGCEKLRYALTDVTDNAPERILHNQMNLLGTHDTERIITVLADTDISGKSNYELSKMRLSPEKRALALTRLKMAYTILSTIPGIPAIFYGDEAGLEGYHDPFNRMPYPWGKEEASLISHYKRLGKIRNENSVYADGSFRLLALTNDLLCFVREDEDSRFVTIVNNSSEELFAGFNCQATELIENVDGEKFIISPFSAKIIRTKSCAEIELGREEKL